MVPNIEMRLRRKVGTIETCSQIHITCYNNIK